MKGLKELPHTTGIYKITNLINNKCYIGQAKDIYRRCNEEHIYGCNNSATASFHIYQAFAKYGIENFSVEVVELCDQSVLNEREIYWIDYYNSIDNGYNIIRGGDCYRGENNIQAKLTEIQVKEIITLLEECKLNNQEIASKYQVCNNTIDLINRC